MTVASIALDAKLDKLLDYAIPEELQSIVQVGSFVEIPVRNALSKGTVIAIKQSSSFPNLKPIERLLAENPVIQPDLLKLSLWMSDYYCTDLSDVLRCTIPSIAKGKTKAKEQYFVKRAKPREELADYVRTIRSKAPKAACAIDVLLPVEKGMLLTELLEKSGTSRQSVQSLVEKGWLSVEKVQLERSPLEHAEFIRSKPKELSGEQKEALEKVVSDLKNEAFSVHLLHGVTGSGKTEVYLQAIESCLNSGKGSILMVPEISLTTQTIERFRSRFEGQIAVIHHRLSDGEKHDEWEKIRSGRSKIVIGARSAIFSPVPNLGLIIVDEEHEASYKQSDVMPAYHARDVAIMRGKYASAVVILGSATPSLESQYNVLSGKYKLSKLTSRPTTASLPTISIIDMKKEYEKRKGITLFSDALLSGIEKRIEKGEQSILFLNRRGYHTSLVCLSCGERVKCPACDITLSFHKAETKLACHLCGYEQTPPRTCLSCGSGEPLKFRGIGTEQVESALYAIFPKVRVLRLDADTTRHKGSHQKLYKAFRTGKADVLIGTQMIAKGLHFPEVTLVGILNSDSSLQIPDFRASETTFQLLTQVAGRAGRGVTAGEVLIQTCMPENEVILHASKQDVEAFTESELVSRKLFAFPPFAQIIKLRFTGPDINQVRESAETFRLALEQEGLEPSPITPCGHARIKEQHRLHFFLKGEKISPLLNGIKAAKARLPKNRNIRSFIDVNPNSTFF